MNKDYNWLGGDQMNKKLFIVLNILYFSFNIWGIRMLPNVLLFGWLPSQMFGYFICAPIASLIWGKYYIKFFKEQKDI